MNIIFTLLFFANYFNMTRSNTLDNVGSIEISRQIVMEFIFSLLCIILAIIGCPEIFLIHAFDD